MSGDRCLVCGTRHGEADDYLDRIADLEEEIERLKAGQGWIAVADALPAVAGTYLVHAPGGYGTSYAVGRWSPGRGWHPHLPEVWARAITHWMPLPEPPKP